MKLILATAICTAGLLSGQQQTTEPVYLLEVAIHQVENDNRTATYDFTLRVRNGSTVSSRTGSRVPFATGGETNKQLQYVDIGANLDITPTAEGDNVRLRVELELSSADDSTDGTPTVKQLRYRVTTVVPTGKKTLIGRLDEPTGSRRYEVEVTASRVTE